MDCQATRQVVDRAEVLFSRNAWLHLQNRINFPRIAADENGPVFGSHLKQEALDFGALCAYIYA